MREEFDFRHRYHRTPFGMCKCFNVKLDGDDDDDDAVRPEIDKVLDDHCSKQTRAHFF